MARPIRQRAEGTIRKRFPPHPTQCHPRSDAAHRRLECVFFRTADLL
jgi:hypothetical protein